MISPLVGLIPHCSSVFLWFPSLLLERRDFFAIGGEEIGARCVKMSDNGINYLP